MKTETRSFYEAAVLRSIAQIARTLDEALDLHALARQAALSPFHFHRVFKGLVGETPLEMHRRLRLERAARRLLDGDEAVTAIAFDAGYETHEAFTRAFRLVYGTSPSSFRRGRADRAQARRIELAAPSGVHFREDSSEEATVAFVAGGPTMNVSLENMPELRVATVAHVGPYNRIAEAFRDLGALAARAGLFAQPGVAMIAIYYDDPETTPVERLRSDAAITVAEGVPLPEGLVEKRLPAGRYARTTHLGPYTRLGDTWARFMGDWLPKSGHRVGNGSSYELYRNDPSSAAPGELLTELYLPIA